MPHISILSSSVRTERKSHTVALYFENYLAEHNLATTQILDLKAYDFPVFEDTLKVQKNPSEKVLDFAAKIKSSDGIIVVTPEYNGGYPASLKNAIDLLYDEWQGKPIALCTVSAGPLGGSQALVALQFVFWKIGANTITGMFCVSDVAKTFDHTGKPSDKTLTNQMAKTFVKKLIQAIDTNQQPKPNNPSK